MSDTPTSSNELFKDLKSDGDEQTKAPETNTESEAGNEADASAAPAETPVENTSETEPEIDPAVELEMLKNRARIMGITFSNNIRADTLRARIKAQLEGEDQQQEEVEASKDGKDAQELTPIQKKMAKRQKMVREQMRLVRVRVTNLNPNKKNLPGEIFTFANETLGAVRKYVPYGEVTENGYHIPYCIYNQLKSREFLLIKTRKGRNGRPVVETSMAREFALEVLPPLTEKEIAQLAAAQAAKGGLNDE